MAVGGTAPVLVNGSGKTPLRIGSVQFRTEECPKNLPIGAGEQMLSKTQLAGGGRISNSYGFDPHDVAWSGTFYTIGNVYAKVKALRLYAVTGVEVLLSWWHELYFCKVKSFVPKYDHENLAGYEITVQITRDANGAFTVSSATNIDSQIQALLASANVTNASMAPSVPTQAQKQFAAMQALISSLNATVASASPIATQITTSGPLVAASANAAADGALALAVAVGETDPNYGTALALQGQTLAIAANATRGQSPQAVNLQGGSLFETAAQSYGDVTQAFALAQINGMPSAWLSASAPRTVTLPPLQSPAPNVSPN